MKNILVSALTIGLLLYSCGSKIDVENKVLILAKRSDEPVAARNSMHKLKYYWNRKLFKDTNPFNALHSKQYDYFLIYIDTTNPQNWQSYSREDFGYKDTSLIPDTLRQKIYIDSIDFKMLEQEH